MIMPAVAGAAVGYAASNMINSHDDKDSDKTTDKQQIDNNGQNLGVVGE